MQSETELQHKRLCPVCNAAHAQLLYYPQQSPGPVVRCGSCSMIYVSPIEKQQALIHDGPVLAELNQSVLTSRNLCDVEGWWEMRELPGKEVEWPALRANAVAALERIERHVPVRGRLLDFGCGFGFFLQAAKARRWDVYGLEPLPAHAVYARAQTGGSIVADTLREDSFPPDFFDVVTAFQVFEHLPDPSGDLGRLYRAMKPGGVILIEVPGCDTWSFRLLGERHRHFVQDHLNFFSAETLRHFLRQQGFTVVETYRPWRTMTARHLIGDWGSRVVPASLSIHSRRIGEGRWLRDKLVSINVGDIVAVLAQKPLASE